MHSPDIRLPEAIARALKDRVDLASEDATKRERYRITRRDCGLLMRWCDQNVIPGGVPTPILVTAAMELNFMWVHLWEAYSDLPPESSAEERQTLIDNTTECSRAVTACMALVFERREDAKQ